MLKQNPRILASGARCWHRRFRQAVDPSATHALHLWETGRTAEALLLLNQLAARNEPAGLAMLAGFKWAGLAGPADAALGRELYRRAAEAGQADARIFTTNLLASGIA